MKIVLSFLTLFIFAACNHQPQKTKVPGKKLALVALLPYKDFDSTLLHLAATETEAFYHCKVIVLPPAELPANAYYESRVRYKADSLLLFQKSVLPPEPALSPV